MTRSTRRPPRLPGGGRRAWAARLACVAVLLLGAWLRVSFSGVPPGDRTDDELFYARYANRIALNGPGYVATFVRHFNADPAGLAYPWPNRAGYLMLAAGAMKLAGRNTVEVVAAVSLASSLLLLLLVWRVGLATLGPWPTAIGLLFLATSPADLAIARRGWQDEMVALLSFAMIASALLRLREPGRLRGAVTFFLLAFLGLLVKESLVIPVGLGTLALAWHAWRASGRLRPALGFLGAGAACALLALGVVVAMSGGLGTLRQAWANAATANAPNAYMVRFQTGTPLYYAMGFARLAPVSMALGALAAALVALRIPATLSPWKTGAARGALVTLAWFSIIFLAIAAAWPQKNLRFVSPVLAPMALLAGALLWALLEAARARAPIVHRVAAGLILVGLAASSVADLARFRTIFLERRIPDLATPMLDPGFRLPPTP